MAESTITLTTTDGYEGARLNITLTASANGANSTVTWRAYRTGGISGWYTSTFANLYVTPKVGSISVSSPIQLYKDKNITLDDSFTGSFVVYHNSAGAATLDVQLEGTIWDWVKTYQSNVYTWELPNRYTKSAAPTKVEVDKQNIKNGETVHISWSGAKAGNGMTISGYELYYKKDNGAYTYFTTVSSSSTSASYNDKYTNQTVGTKYSYAVKTKSSAGSSWDSDLSSAIATCTIINTAPAAPGTSVNKTEVGIGQTVTLGATAGYDPDPGQTKTVRYRINSGAYTTLSGTSLSLIPSLYIQGTDKKVTVDFYTYDGSAYSNPAPTITITVRDNPTKGDTSLSASTGHIGNTEYCYGVTFNAKPHFYSNDGKGTGTVKLDLVYTNTSTSSTKTVNVLNNASVTSDTLSTWSINIVNYISNETIKQGQTITWYLKYYFTDSKTGISTSTITEGPYTFHGFPAATETLQFYTLDPNSYTTPNLLGRNFYLRYPNDSNFTSRTVRTTESLCSFSVVRNISSGNLIDLKCQNISSLALNGDKSTVTVTETWGGIKREITRTVPKINGSGLLANLATGIGKISIPFNEKVSPSIFNIAFSWRGTTDIDVVLNEFAANTGDFNIIFKAKNSTIAIKVSGGSISNDTYEQKIPFFTYDSSDKKCTGLLPNLFFPSSSIGFSSNFSITVQAQLASLTGDTITSNIVTIPVELGGDSFEIKYLGGSKTRVTTVEGPSTNALYIVEQLYPVISREYKLYKDKTYSLAVTCNNTSYNLQTLSVTNRISKFEDLLAGKSSVYNVLTPTSTISEVGNDTTLTWNAYIDNISSKSATSIQAYRIIPSIITLKNISVNSSYGVNYSFNVDDWGISQKFPPSPSLAMITKKAQIYLVETSDTSNANLTEAITTYSNTSKWDVQPNPVTANFKQTGWSVKSVRLYGELTITIPGEILVVNSGRSSYDIVKKFYSNSVIIYATTPTVAYRQNYLGINTTKPSDLDTSNKSVVTIQSTSGRDSLLFGGVINFDESAVGNARLLVSLGDHSIKWYDANSIANFPQMQIDGFLIDGGTW